MYFPNTHMKKTMQLPQPKVLIPALFAVVTGIPMLIQTSFGTMELSASATDVVQQEGIDADALIDVAESDYSYEVRHYLRRSLRLGTCNEAWKTINKGVYLLCKRSLDEMGGSDRQKEIDTVIQRTQRSRLHGAGGEDRRVNDRLDAMENAKPESAREVPRFQYRRDGSNVLPQDK